MNSVFRPASFAVALLLALGCSPVERADLVFVNGGEPETLDPAVSTDQLSGRVAGSLFEGLTRIDEKGKAGPGMAESWQISDDGLRYRFTLREGIVWSSGEPVTADDFARSWRRVLEPETGADYASILYYIKGTKAFSEACAEVDTESARERAERYDVLFKELAGIRALDDRTLELEVENPTAFLLDILAFPTLYPVHLPSVEQHGDEWIKPGNLVSNGPYLLEAWRLEDRIRLRKNPDYWDADNVALETIDMLPTDNANTAVNFFIAGEVDVIMDKGMIPSGMTDKLREQEWFHTGPFLGTYFVRFNVDRPPFDDVRVRKAFAMCVDKQRIVDTITRLDEPIAHGFCPPGAGQDFQPSGKRLPYDPEQAAQLLVEAGHPGGKGLPSLEVLLRTKTTESQISSELRSMWDRHLGAPVSLHKQEPRVYYASQRGQEYHLSPSSWVGDYNDPNTFLDLFLGDNGNNRTGFDHPEYNRLIAEAAAETDPVRRNGIFARAEEILVVEQAVVIPLYHYVGVQFYRADEIGGIEANLVDVHPFRCMYWKKDRSKK